jgi:hypothetical protein
VQELPSVQRLRECMVCRSSSCGSESVLCQLAECGVIKQCSTSLALHCLSKQPLRLLLVLCSSPAQASVRTAIAALHHRGHKHSQYTTDFMVLK